MWLAGAAVLVQDEPATPLQRRGEAGLLRSKPPARAPLVAFPSLPPWLAWVRVPLYFLKALQMPVLELSEQTSHTVPLVATPIRYAWESMYTPPQEGDGYR